MPTTIVAGPPGVVMTAGDDAVTGEPVSKCHFGWRVGAVSRLIVVQPSGAAKERPRFWPNVGQSQVGLVEIGAAPAVDPRPASGPTASAAATATSKPFR